MNPKNLRNLKNREFDIIQASLTQISSKINQYLQDRRSCIYLIISEYKAKDQIYLITENLKNVLTNFQSDLKIASAGIFLGFILKNNFFLSLEGAELFLKENLIPEEVILRVNDEGEKSILYGNPVERKMIPNISSTMQKNSIIFILNKSSELISIGYSEVDIRDLDAFKERDILIKNLIDKGYYLRRPQ
jgi:ribosome biogenesis protein Nip4